jgi:hypothetical protein
MGNILGIFLFMRNDKVIEEDGDEEDVRLAFEDEPEAEEISLGNPIFSPT